MEVYEAIACRKTVRSFSSLSIDPDLVKKLIATGMKAPSNDHLRSWHFIILPEKAQREALVSRLVKPISRRGAIGVVNRWGMKDEIQREMYIEAIPLQYAMLVDAAVIILPCFRQTPPLFKAKTLFSLNGLASIWCCIENILIAAASEGIFGVTRIPFDEERKELKTLLSIPEEYEVPCYLALGYPAEGIERAKQLPLVLEEHLHYGVRQPDNTPQES